MSNQIDISKESYHQTVWRRFRRHKLAMISLICVGVMGLVALFATVIAPYDPEAILGAFSAPPSLKHWLGTDQIGRDVLSRLLYGMRVSILVGLVTTLISRRSE